jgi:hypothetical protein
MNRAFHGSAAFLLPAPAASSHESFECQRDYTNTYILMSERHKLSTNFGNIPVEWIKLT